LTHKFQFIFSYSGRISIIDCIYLSYCIYQLVTLSGVSRHQLLCYQGGEFSGVFTSDRDWFNSYSCRHRKWMH